MKKDRDPTELIGCVLHDSHRITRLIGQGGMGAVYEAEHIRLSNRRFAVKVLRESMIGSQSLYTRFQREAEITTQLGHPNIIDVLDFYKTDDGQPCIVMELLEGEDLQQRLDRMAPLTHDELAAVMRQTGSALQAAHDGGVVHRDLKPANIFLVRDGKAGDQAIQVKVLDFGISKMQHASIDLTQEGEILGTPRYMAPEVAGGTPGDVDHRADIFAMAVIACEVLTGKVPFEAETAPGTIFKILKEEPEIGSLDGQPLPAELLAVLERGLAKERDQRYGRVAELVEDLCQALEALEAPGAPEVLELLALAETPGVPGPAGRRPGEGGTRTIDLHDDGSQSLELDMPRGVDGDRSTGTLARQGRGRGGRGALLVVLLLLAGAATAWFFRADLSRLLGGIGGREASILLLVETEPHNADVYVDGELVTTSPVRLPRTGRSVEVQVKAFGYKTRTLRVKSDRTRSVYVRLRPVTD